MGVRQVGVDDAMVLLEQDWVKDRILHWEDTSAARPSLAGPTQPLPEFLAGICLRRGLGVPQRPSEATISGTVLARVDWGRWLADCPNALCANGAEMVSVQTPVFICASCGSPESGGKWYAVKFPCNKAAIERELLLRPAVALIGDVRVGRGWAPGQSLAALRAEREALS